MVKDRELTVETTAGVGVVYMILAIATTYAAPLSGASTLRIAFAVVGVIFAAIAVGAGLLRGSKMKKPSSA